jgi:hypothetical protein
MAGSLFFFVGFFWFWILEGGCSTGKRLKKGYFKGKGRQGQIEQSLGHQ